MFIKPLVVAVALALPGLVQAQAQPAVVSQFVGNTVAQAAIQRGFAANDPRIHATMYSIGQRAVGVAAGAGGGLLVAGSVPAWATVIAGLAIGTAVSLAVDKAVSWLFGTNDVTPSGFPVTGPQPAGTTAGGQAWVGNIWDANSNSNKLIYAGDPYTALSGMFRCTGNGTYYCSTASTKYYIKDCTANSGGTSYTCQVWQLYVPTNSASYVQSWSVGSGTSPSTCAAGTVSLQGAGGCVAAPSIPSDPNSTANNQNGVAVPMSTAVSKLPSDIASAPVDYGTMAGLINNLWQQAAAQPGYAGVPYDSSRPVTAGQVQTAAQANPSAYPSVAAVVAPVPNPSTGLVPAPNGTPVTTPTPETSTNPSTQPQTNLGPDPNIGFNKPDTPTADMVFSPFTSLTAPFLDFQINAPVGECPKPHFDVFGESINMTQHCDIFESFRNQIQAVMTAVFMIAAFVIIFTA